MVELTEWSLVGHQLGMGDGVGWAYMEILETHLSLH